MLGRCIQRTMERHDVRARKKLGEGHQTNSRREHIRRRFWIKRDHLTAKTAHDRGENESDTAGPDHADRFPVEIKPKQANNREVALSSASIGAVSLTVERE